MYARLGHLMPFVRVCVFSIIAFCCAAPGALAQTVINGTTETVPAFVVPLNDDLSIGTTGTGALDILNGTVITDTTTLGVDATGNGTLTATGALATFQTNSSFTIGDGGTGTFSVTGGGTAATAEAYIGNQAGSIGTATVSGVGSSWTLTGDLRIGGDGTGTLNVTDGAVLDTATNTIYIGNSDGANGTFNASGGSTITSGDTYIGYCGGGCDPVPVGVANISGAGTTWTLGDLVVGYEGANGTLNITDGAVVNASELIVSEYYSSGATQGDVTVSGANSELNIVGDATIGDGSPATMVVSNGALFQIGGDAYVGYYPTSISTVTVTGADSAMTIGGDAHIGYEGLGTVTVSNGASLSVAGTTYIGEDDNFTTPSSLTVTGTGSELLANSIQIGTSSGALGTLTIANGAYVEAGQIAAGFAPGSTGTVNISGASTELDSGATLYAGYSGTGTVNIFGGVKLDVNHYVSSLYAGYDSLSQGTINISGPGTEVFVDNYVYVGDSGSGILNVTDGAVVTADYLYGGGAGAGGGSAMLVSGAGTHFNANYGAYIGYSGDFDVVVTDDGLLSASLTSLQIGYNTGYTGVVEASNGGRVTSGQSIIVGGQGDGTLALSTGASATANSVTIAAQPTSVGKLIFGAAAADPAVATGTLSAPTVAFGAGAGEIIFNHTSNLTFAPTVSGSGAISVLAGTTTFATDSATFFGDVDVTGGKAVFNADYSGAAVEVSGGGIVGGNGTIVSLDVLSGGTVAPGNSPGTIHVIEGTTFAAGSTYTVEVAGVRSDLISTGSAELNGGTVEVSGSPSLMRYTILTSTMAITGAGFEGVETTSAFIRYSLDYDPNNVYLVIDGYNALTTAARTPNQYAVANALDKFPAGNPLYSAIIGGSVADAQQALNALSGEIHASVGTALADDSRYVREAITGRLIQAYYGGVSGGGQPIVLAATAPTDVATIDDTSRMSLGAGQGDRGASPAGAHDLAYWSRAFGAWGQHDSNGNAATMDRDLGGFITGVDGGLGGGWRAGLATGYMHAGLNVDDRSSSAQVDSYVLGGYAGGAIGAFALRSGGTWTWNDIDTSRSVVFPGFFESESASYGGDTGQLFAELAYPTFVHGGVVEPFAGLAYVHIGTDGFTESGPLAGLTGSDNTANVGYGTLGARAGATWVWGSTTVVPHASLAWQYAFGDTTPLQSLAFASTGIGMGIGGVPLAQSSALLDIGADIVIAEDATLGLSYIGQYANDVQDNGLRGRFNWRY